MRPLLPLASLLLALPAAAYVQQPNQVANYYAGTPGTSSYQHFSFWSHEGRRYNLQYSRDSTRTDITARYVGPAQVAGAPGFRVSLANGQLRYVVPADSVLLVRATPTGPATTFRWEYQGPVNGVGTACSVCAPNAGAAMRLVRRYFVR